MTVRQTVPAVGGGSHRPVSVYGGVSPLSGPVYLCTLFPEPVY